MSNCDCVCNTEVSCPWRRVPNFGILRWWSAGRLEHALNRSLLLPYLVIFLADLRTTWMANNRTPTFLFLRSQRYTWQSIMLLIIDSPSSGFDLPISGHCYSSLTYNSTIGWNLVALYINVDCMEHVGVTFWRISSTRTHIHTCIVRRR